MFNIFFQYPTISAPGLLLITTIFSLIFNAGSARAATTVDEFIAALYQAKELTEGPAKLIQGCSTIGGDNGAIRQMYDTARISFNSRIDGIIYILNNGQLDPDDITEKAEFLSESFKSINAFNKKASSIINSHRCGRLHRMGYMEILQLIITPDMLKAVIGFISSRVPDGQPSNRDKLVKILNEKKILEWGALRSTIRLIYYFDPSDYDTAEGIQKKSNDGQWFAKDVLSPYISNTYIPYTGGANIFGTHLAWSSIPIYGYQEEIPLGSDGSNRNLYAYLQGIQIGRTNHEFSYVVGGKSVGLDRRPYSLQSQEIRRFGGGFWF